MGVRGATAVDGGEAVKHAREAQAVNGGGNLGVGRRDRSALGTHHLGLFLRIQTRALVHAERDEALKQVGAEYALHIGLRKGLADRDRVCDRRLVDRRKRALWRRALEVHEVIVTLGRGEARSDRVCMRLSHAVYRRAQLRWHCRAHLTRGTPHIDAVGAAHSFCGEVMRVPQTSQGHAMGVRGAISGGTVELRERCVVLRLVRGDRAPH